MVGLLIVGVIVVVPHSISVTVVVLAVVARACLRPRSVGVHLQSVVLVWCGAVLRLSGLGGQIHVDDGAREEFEVRTDEFERRQSHGHRPGAAR